MHFYMGNHFCVLQVCPKHLGAHHYCQLSVAGELVCKLASFIPSTEDLQDLTQEDGSTGLQPSISWLYDTTVQSPFLLAWQGHKFPCALTVNTPRSTFPTSNVDPLSRSCRIGEALCNFRLAFHVLVQKLNGCFRPFRIPASRGRLYWQQVLMKQRCNGQALYLVLISFKVI